MHPINISPSQCLTYYYQPDPIFGMDSKWYGNLSQGYKIYGLPCTKHDFLNLAIGNDLKGNQVIKDGRNKDEQSFHRAAVDFSFSPPKSVSITSLHIGDDFVIKAHLKAVETTLDYIEKNYIYVRQTDCKNTVALKTGEGLFAIFNHSISRANDPQLHSHSLLFNHTVYPRGHRSVYFDQLFREQKLVTQIYLSALAKNIKELEYGIELHGDGKWEIAGVKKEWLQQFSKRTYDLKKIENELIAGDTYPNARRAKLRKIAVLKSRPNKNSSINKKQLKEQWEKEVPQKLIIKSVEKYKNKPVPKKKLSPKDYILLASISIHETECLFTQKKILENSLQLSFGHFTIADIEKTFREMKANNEIVEVAKYVNNKNIVNYQYTSLDIKKTEQAIIDQFKKGKDSCIPMISAQKANEVISNRYDYFSDAQKKMIQFILTSKARMMLVQGEAGTGKTSSLKALRDILGNEKPGVEIIALGYRDKAAQDLKDVAGIESRTISSFVNEPRNQSTVERLIICNDTSMLVSLQANEIIDKVSCENSRLVLIGDGKQLQALSAGKMFLILQEMDVPYIEMSQVLRQKTELIQKAVCHIKDFQTGKNNHGIDNMFGLLKKDSNIIEIQGKTELMKSVVVAYLTGRQKDDTLIITASDKDRLELNNTIRAKLKKNGKIGNKDIQTEISVPIHLPGIQRYFSKNYELKQKIFIEQYDLTNDKKELFDATIIAVNPKSNSFQVLTRDKGKKQIFLGDKNIRTHVTLYESQKRTFSINDKVIFLKNNPSLGVQNGLIGKIEKINNKGGFYIRSKDLKRLLKIYPKEFPWLDHAHAIKIHKSQETTSPNVILLADTRYKNLNKTESLYVAISKAERQIKVFTNDIHQLKEQCKNGQDKTSPHLPEKHLETANTKKLNIEKEIER